RHPRPRSTRSAKNLGRRSRMPLPRSSRKKIHWAENPLAKAAREYLARREQEKSPLRKQHAAAIGELANAADAKAMAAAELKVARIEAALLHERVGAALTRPGSSAEEATALVQLGSAARQAHGHGRQALGIDDDAGGHDPLQGDIDK